MISNDDFKKTIDDFLKKNNLSAARFGLLAKNDPRFVFRVMQGQEVKESGKIRVLNFMRNFKKSSNLDIPESEEE